MSLASPGRKPRATSTSPRKKSRATSTAKPHLDETLYADKLGKLVRQSVQRFSTCESWSAFVEDSRGRPYLAETVKDIPHPAAAFLDDLRQHGVPAKANDPEWTPKERDDKFQRGAHVSAEMNKAFIREEMAEFMECGYWTVLPYHLVRLLPGLRVSPLGVKEERARKARLICDHTFFGVNQSTVLRTPPEAMQFGGTLNHIL